MEVIVKISERLCEGRVQEFLSTLKFPALSLDRVAIPAFRGPQGGKESDIFYIEAMPGGSEFDEGEIQEHLDNQTDSLLLFNAEAAMKAEPKVIYLTDLSPQSNVNLELFKRLRPAGFCGATVITEAETICSKMAWKLVSQQILERIRSAAQSSRANLIIANYDFGNTGQKFTRMACLSQLVSQNRCHVLILKS